MSVYFTPVGMVPKSYPHFQEFLDKARIRMKRTTEKMPDGTEREYIDWSIIGDVTMDEKGKQKTTVTRHNNFCVLLDYISFKIERMKEKLGVTEQTDIQDVLDICIGRKHAIVIGTSQMLFDRTKMQDIKKLKLEMQSLNNPKYSTIASQSRRPYSGGNRTGKSGQWEHLGDLFPTENS